MNFILSGVAGRGLVYISGFALVWYTARNLESAEFGQWAIIQAIVELSLVVGALGMPVVLLRQSSAAPGRPLISSLLWNWSLGATLAVVLATVLLTVQELRLHPFAIVAVAFTPVLHSLSLLMQAVLRGNDRTEIGNSEATIRNSTVILLLFVVVSISEVVRLELIIYFTLIGQIVVAAISARMYLRICLREGWTAVSIAERLSAVTFALSQFAARKSDVLMAAIALPLSSIGPFKVAFLLTEAPSQFVQSYLVSRTKAIKSDSSGESIVILGLRSLAVAAAMLVLLIIVLRFVPIGIPDQALILEYSVWMAPYYLVRSYTSSAEQFLLLNGEMSNIWRRGVAEFAIRASTFAFVFFGLGLDVSRAYPVVAAFELMLYSYLIGRYKRSQRTEGSTE